MLYRKDAVCMAVMSLLASAGMVSAESAKLSLDPTATLAEAPAQRAPLMAGLDAIGAAKGLDSLGLNIYGYIQAGYLYNPGRSSGQGNVGQGGMGPGTNGRFNNDNHFALNQVDIAIERVVDTTKWDVGGKMEWVYGMDARAMHSYGMQKMYNGMDGDSPEYQFDPYQIYVDVAVPVGNGLKLRAGKFASLFGYETVNPNLNPFYTTSMLTSYAQPTTMTGLIAFYNLNDQWSLAGGVIRGWDDDFLDDKNDNGVSGIIQVGWTPSKGFQNYLTASYGPENSSEFDETQNGKDRFAFDYVLKYQLNDRWSLGLNVDYIYDQGSDVNGKSASWFGAAGYVSYLINEYFTANGRVEWYSDQDQVNLGSFVDPTALVGPSATQAWGISLGVTIRPMPKDPIGSNLMIRPEVTYYYADHDIYSGGDNRNQFLLGGDVVFSF